MGRREKLFLRNSRGEPKIKSACLNEVSTLTRTHDMADKSQAQYKILMIEDNESISDILTFILEREGYAVELAADGQAGERLIGRTAPPDAILLDVTLPFVDGFQLVRTIRRTATWEHVPVIMLSGHSNQNFIDEALSVGANEYIVKPFQRDELLRCMRKLATRRETSPAT
jgi:DNA-binding response OmpR family regulator